MYQKVTVNVPIQMWGDLRKRAASQGLKASDLLRRAIRIERLLFEEPDNEVIIRNARLGKEKTSAPRLRVAGHRNGTPAFAGVPFHYSEHIRVESTSSRL